MNSKGTVINYKETPKEKQKRIARYERIALKYNQITVFEILRRKCT